MKKSKLLSILKSLDKQAFGKLKKFMQVPYFVEVKQKQKVLKLFEILIPYYPGFGHKNLEKEKLYRQLFSDTDYSPSKMDRLMNHLLTVIKKFILIEYTINQQEEGYKELILARFYLEKGLNNDFKSTARTFRKKQEQVLPRSSQYYLHNYLMEAEQSYFASFYNQRKADLNLPNTIKSLDIFYICSRLQHACTLMAQQFYHVPLGLQADLFRYEEISDLIQSSDYLEVPIIKVYYNAFQLLYLKDDDEQFDELLEVLNQNKDFLPNEQLRAIQTICRSYCIRRYYKGNEKYLQKAFDLYKSHLENGYLYHDGGIFAGMLKNLIVVGLKMKQFDWVLQNIEAHKHRIIGTHNQEEVYRFNLASYYFAKKDYPKTLEYLCSYEKDTYYKVSAKRLELKVYFEMDSPLLDFKMKAFKVYLFRVSNKILSKIAQEGNNNFINLLYQMHNTQTYRNPDRIKKLVEKIKSQKVVIERDWLLEQLEKLKG